MVSETILREFGYKWSQVVLMGFSLQKFGERVMRSSSHCLETNRPRLWLDGNIDDAKDFTLCDNLIYVSSPSEHHSPERDAFVKFARKKKRIMTTIKR